MPRKPAYVELREYHRDIERRPVPSEAEIASLLARYRSGDPSAREGLIESCLWLAWGDATKFSLAAPHIPIGDLIQEANMGLVIAADKFDPNMGIKFVTYAKWWIKSKLFDCLRHDRSIHIPNYILEVIRLQKKGQPIPAKYEAYVESALPAMRVVGESAYDPGDWDSMVSISDDGDHEGSAHEEISDVRRLIGLLPKQHQAFIRSLFGIDAVQRFQHQIAEDHGLSRQRVQQVIKDAIEHLKDARFREGKAQFRPRRRTAMETT